MSSEVLEVRYALDTFYLLMSGALVMWMAAGFTMLESGLVRAKHTAEILTKNVLLYCVACVMYLLVGYQIMYGESSSSVIPSLGFLIGADNSLDALMAGGDDAPTYSVSADFFYQVVFVATAMSVVSGAVAERMKLWSFLLFAVVMTAVIYPVQGYWKWGGGFLDVLGFKDFAGSGIVHLTGAMAALTGITLLGARIGKFGPKNEPRALPGANLPLAAIGMWILWFGWFGFNGGSELRISNLAEANAVAGIFVNTNAAAVAGALVAALLSKGAFGKADLTMILNGALAGLVAITAEPLTPTPLLATAIGAFGGAIVVGSVLALERLRLDDPVGAISVHGTAGIFGLMAVPLSNGEASFGVQFIGVITIIAWTGVTTFITWSIIKAIVGIRVAPEEELTGLDISECGLLAYPEFVSSDHSGGPSRTVGQPRTAMSAAPASATPAPT